MAPGADRTLNFDPPGAIGLVDLEAVLLLRFDEDETAIPPSDATEQLEDLGIEVAGTAIATTLPEVTDGVTGRARAFLPSLTTGLAAKDRTSGTSLMTRDASIQVILSWAAAAQLSYGQPGNIVSRGTGASSSEYLAYGLEIVPVDASTGTLRWRWQDVAGVAKVQLGAQFAAASGTWTMLTATRRWVSPTEVVLRYYIGDLLLVEVTSADGSIGGGTTGTLQVGSRFSGSNGSYLAGSIDELLLVDRELCAEEVEATWLRITRYQPLGYQLFREMHDQGFPIPTDQSTDAQMDIRMTGHALGYAAAQAENLRSNFLPQRSYGDTLAQWEEAVQVTPEPADSIQERRERVLARIRQLLGISTDGLRDSLEGLLGGATSDDLEFISFSNTVTDHFDTFEPERWDVTPVGAMTIPGGVASFQPGAPSGPFTMDGGTRSWLTARQSISGPVATSGKQVQQVCKVAMTGAVSTLEGGIYYEDATANNVLLFGLRDNAGTFELVTESFIGNISQGLVVQHTFGGNPANLWLHLYQTTVDGTWLAAWSTTSGTTGFTATPGITHPTIAHWAGIYMRSTIGFASPPRVDYDDHVLRTPFGTRPLSAYVLLDSVLGFSPDIDGARSVIKAIKHGYTHATFIVDRSLLCDDPDTGCDEGPMGGI